MQNLYWISFTRWNTYKFKSTKKGYWLAKRIYRKGWRWTPFIKLSFHEYTNYNNYGKR
jgi:hypothetical protein